MTDTTAITKFLQNPEDFAAHIKANKDFGLLIEVVKGVIGVVRDFDTYLDIVIRAGEEVWIPSEHDGEDYRHFVIRESGLAPVTVDRHTKVGQALQKIPDQYRPQIEKLKVKEKNALADAVIEGFKFEDKDWQDIASAHSYQDVGEVVRRVKGKQPRKQWMRFKYDKDEGIIYVSTHEGEFEYLRVNNDPGIQDIIERANRKLFKMASITPRMRY